MRVKILLLITLLCAFCLSACSTANPEVDVIAQDNSVSDLVVEVRANGAPPDDTPKTGCSGDIGEKQRRLCDAVAPKKLGEDDAGWYERLEFTYAETDLNGDGKDEMVVWESSWSGTGGGSFWVLADRGDKYTVLYTTEMTWAPIVVLNSKSKGWNDIAFYTQGGGIKPTFVSLSYNKGYKPNDKGTNEMPEGKVLIKGNWSGSVFGPVSGN